MYQERGYIKVMSYFCRQEEILITSTTYDKAHHTMDAQPRDVRRGERERKGCHKAGPGSTGGRGAGFGGSNGTHRRPSCLVQCRPDAGQHPGERGSTEGLCRTPCPRESGRGEGKALCRTEGVSGL